MEGGAGAVDSSDSFVMCGGFAFKGLAVVCLAKDGGISVDARVVEVESSEAGGSLLV